MKNLYRKVAVASVCTALGFALVANKEAKAATITLTDGVSDFVFDKNNDGLGDGHYGNVYLVPVGIGSTSAPRWEGATSAEFRSLYEFNIASLSLTSNTITKAIFQTRVDSWSGHYYYFSLELWGYKGNGHTDDSDFEAGRYLNSHRRSFLSEPGFNFNLLNIDVTPFVNELVSNNDAFAGFTIRANRYGSASLSTSASLTITTEPVPEPTTIFGSALALGVGGWLKRKKSTSQNKAKSQA